MTLLFDGLLYLAYGCGLVAAMFVVTVGVVWFVDDIREHRARHTR